MSGGGSSGSSSGSSSVSGSRVARARRSVRIDKLNAEWACINV